MPRRARASLLVTVCVFGIAASQAGAAVPLVAQGYDPVDGPPPAGMEHPGGPGHLPPGSRNMDLVSKLKLTNVDGGIADVAAFKNYAYLNAFSPECAGRPGAAGTGVHIVDISDPS